MTGYIRRKAKATALGVRGWFTDLLMGLVQVALHAIKNASTVLLAAATFVAIVVLWPDLYLDFVEKANEIWRGAIAKARAYSGRGTWVASAIAAMDYGGRGGYTLLLAAISAAWGVVFLIMKLILKGIWLLVVKTPAQRAYDAVCARLRRPNTQTARLPPPPQAPPRLDPPVTRRRRT